jgi:hypothetical protein
MTDPSGDKTMRSILSLITLAAIVIGLHHFYARSFNPKPLADKLANDPILNPNHPEIQDSARTINFIQDEAEMKIAEGKRLADAAAAKANQLTKIVKKNENGPK